MLQLVSGQRVAIEVELPHALHTLRHRCQAIEAQIDALQVLQLLKAHWQGADPGVLQVELSQILHMRYIRGEPQGVVVQAQNLKLSQRREGQHVCRRQVNPVT
ncbi:hypothetical protein D3C76_1464910 [compost metagenome]